MHKTCSGRFSAPQTSPKHGISMFDHKFSRFYARRKKKTGGLETDQNFTQTSWKIEKCDFQTNFLQCIHMYVIVTKLVLVTSQRRRRHRNTRYRCLIANWIIFTHVAKEIDRNICKSTSCTEVQPSIHELHNRATINPRSTISTNRNVCWYTTYYEHHASTLATHSVTAHEWMPTWRVRLTAVLTPFLSDRYRAVNICKAYITLSDGSRRSVEDNKRTHP